MNYSYSRNNIYNTIKQTIIVLTGILSLVFCLDVPESYSEEASEYYEFERMWPTLPQPWYFSPADIAVGNDGNIYVADRGGIIHKLTSEGNFITKWGSSGSSDGQFDSPKGITVDSSGNVYVVDSDNDRIQKFDSEGNFITKWGSSGSSDGQFSHPVGIAVDSSGNVYVVDSDNDRIQKFDSEGNFITKWGSSGSSDGQFFSPRGIAVDSNGNVYVLDSDGVGLSARNRIQKFDSDGDFITKLGSEGSGDGQWIWGVGIRGIAVDSEGNFYVVVVGDGNYRIQIFDSDGSFITKWGSEGSSDGKFYEIAVDSEGNFYVVVLADARNYSIQKFDSDGNFIAKWGSYGSGDGQFSLPVGIAVDSTGNVYVADTGNDRIQKFDSDGNFIAKLGSEGSGDGQFSGPEGIAVDSNGNVYVVDTRNHRIQKFDSDGNFITKWGSRELGDGQFYNPRGIAVDSNGNVYVADEENHRIQKFDSDGNFITKWGSEGTGDGQFSQPAGIAVDSTGNVYVTDVGRFLGDNQINRIQKYDSDGNFVTKWGSKGSGDGQFDNPRGIAVDSDGNVYVADAYNSRIQKFDSDGNFIAKFGTRGSSPGQFRGPYDLDIDTNGNLYIADSWHDRIQVLKRVTASSERKAIVVAGGGPFTGNNLWETTQMLANYAYNTLTFQGYTKETIYYLSADTDLDLDGNGILDDVDADATNDKLEKAITAWATDASEVVIYLVDHGGDGTFRMRGTEIMTAAEFDSWLDILQESITGKLTVVYEACESGSFMDALAPSSGQDRMLITSTSPDENAYFVSKGSISFSFIFWGHIFGGSNVYDAFTLASNSISFSIEGQTPLLDDNGNGIGNEKGDGLVAINYYIGNGVEIGGDLPLIGAVSSEQSLNGTTSTIIWAEGIITTGTIERVWAVIKRPDSIPGSSDIPITDIPILDLKDADNDGRYEGTYNEFDINGIYEINIYAKDRKSNISLPKATKVNQEAGTDSGINPIPDIKANGSDGPFTISQGYNLSVTVTLGTGDHSGENADYWVYCNSPFGVYSYSIDGNWTPSNVRTHGGPVFSLPTYTVLDMSLPIGNYTFTFSVDDNMDNVKNDTYSDSVQVTIE